MHRHRVGLDVEEDRHRVRSAASHRPIVAPGAVARARRTSGDCWASTWAARGGVAGTLEAMSWLPARPGRRVARRSWSTPSARSAATLAVHPQLLRVVADHRAGVAAPRRRASRSPVVLVWAGPSTRGRLGRPGPLRRVLGRPGRHRRAGPAPRRAPPRRRWPSSGSLDDPVPRHRCDGPATSRSPGSAGRVLKLDVYDPADPPPPGARRPAVLQIHGGAWVIGDKRSRACRCSRHLAVDGWVGFNANYRLSPAATWPDHLVDLKAALVLIREHADEYGIDPELRRRHRRLGRRSPHRDDGADPATIRSTSPASRTPTPPCRRRAVLRRLRLHQPQRDDAAAVPRRGCSSRWIMKAFYDDEPEQFRAARRSITSTPMPRRSS